jgi:hypothetical protein
LAAVIEAPLGEREDMVKVQFVHGTTHGALRVIAFPDVKLDVRRDQPGSFCVHVNRLFKIFIAFDCNQLELAYGAELVTFHPRIDKVKDTVV